MGRPALPSPPPAPRSLPMVAPPMSGAPAVGVDAGDQGERWTNGEDTWAPQWGDDQGTAWQGGHHGAWDGFRPGASLMGRRPMDADHYTRYVTPMEAMHKDHCISLVYDGRAPPSALIGLQGFETWFEHVKD